MSRRLARVLLDRLGIGDRVARRRTGTLVVMYHSIAPPEEETPYAYSTPAAVFERHIALFDELGQFVGPETVCGERPPDTTGGLNVLVTFDDGYRNVLEVAAPILNDYDAPAIAFVTTTLLDADRESFMDWAALRELAAYDGFSIGSHCCHHWNLTALRPADARAEIRDSKVRIERELDTDVSYFSYPSGGYTPELATMVSEAGYDAAFRDQPNDGRDRYALGRFGIDKHNQSYERLTACLATIPLVR